MDYLYDALGEKNLPGNEILSVFGYLRLELERRNLMEYQEGEAYDSLYITLNSAESLLRTRLSETAAS